MKKIIIASAAGLGLSIFATAVLAGPGGRDGAHWDRLDSNSDGKISSQELSAANADLIEKADSDGDGAISKDEMQAYHKARRAEKRAKFNADKNNDGVVDRTEFINAAQERFDRMDKNGDGVLSEDERHRRGKHRRGHGHKRDKD